jgi:hypothetical protein
MKSLRAAILGALLGASATLLHTFFFPIGLIFGLLGTFVGIWAIGRQSRQRRFKILATLFWVVIVVNGATVGVGGELLIQGDLAGSLLVLLGTLTLLLAILLPV